MALKIHNSLTRSIDTFEPQDASNVSLYSCGPTVYDYPHIGNYRAYIFVDILKRYLIYRGFTVNHVMNITDIDDKTIRDSQKENKSLAEFTEFYTLEFLKDIKSLNILPATKYTKATDYIDEMVKMIQALIDKGHAYKAEDGSVYFKIESFADYGKLSHIDIKSLKSNASCRVNNDEYDKDNIQDFALWKAWDKSDGDVFWTTILGKGRPGWHIECSAMSTASLGNTIDIHTGGVDNMFPHHENEIAQSECSTGQKFVKYWMHNEWLLVNGKKMAKSAGNFYTLRDLIDKGINPIGYKLWLQTSHYRTLTNLNMVTLEGSNTALKRLQEAFKALPEDSTGNVDSSYKERFIAFMDDDLDTPQALALLWELVKDTEIAPADKRATMLDFDRVFGFGLDNLEDEVIPEEVLILVQDREQARLHKNWDLSDNLRAKIEAHGYEVKDTEKGAKIIKI